MTSPDSTTMAETKRSQKPVMNRLNILLLSVLMLVIGWEARGVRERQRFNDELDCRLVRSIVLGISAGWLTPNWDSVDAEDDVGTRMTHSLNQPD